MPRQLDTRLGIVDALKTREGASFLLEHRPERGNLDEFEGLEIARANTQRARALGDPKRLCVLESLAGGEASVGELASRVSCQVPNMSQHLAVLRAAGLVASRREGSTVFYRLADDRVLEAYRRIRALAGGAG